MMHFPSLKCPRNWKREILTPFLKVGMQRFIFIKLHFQENILFVLLLIMRRCKMSSKTGQLFYIFQKIENTSILNICNSKH
jgi:hypothetical protein